MWTGITVENCVISNGGTGIWLGNNTGNLVFQSIKNSIFTGNNPGIYFSSSYENRDIYNNDFWGNSPNFSGSLPAGLGVITGNNINGDPCDVYGNIFLNPLFVNPPVNFNLQPGSPCIDGGEIDATNLDPDFTLKDIGAYYFPQIPSLTVELEPVNPPIIIPPSGGNFYYNFNAVNANSAGFILDIWTDITLPNGQTISAFSLTSDRVFPGNANISRDSLIQYVQARAPAGSYDYVTKMGIYPNVIFTQDTLYFTKASELAGGNFLDVSARSADFNLGISPNPFNHSTTLNFNLPSEEYIAIYLYDVTGR
jgi:hypothetical protein